MVQEAGAFQIKATAAPMSGEGHFLVCGWLLLGACSLELQKRSPLPGLYSNGTNPIPGSSTLLT